jgi:hypothetical protein
MVLRDRVDARFDAVVTSVDRRGASIQLREPAVLARLDGDAHPSLGAEITVRLDSVDPQAGNVHFEVAR